MSRCKTTSHLTSLLLIFSAISVACGAEPSAPAASSDTWTQWRGAARTAQLTGPAWPTTLSETHLKPSWNVSMGPSYSGPIVAKDRIFVTETVDGRYEVARALDRASGKEIWRQKWEGAMKVPFFAAANGSWIRATPAYDGERLYVAGMRDYLVCLDADTGDRLWSIDFVKQFGGKLPDFGFASSPLLWQDHLYVQAGGGFAKIDKVSGEIIWRSLTDGGGMYGSAFSSPAYAEIHGQPQLLVQTRSHLAGVHPDDGRVLWKQEVPAFRGMNILTPIAIGDSVFTSSYGGRSFLFDIKRDGDSWSVEESWAHKSQGYMSTPVVIDGHIYMHLRNQRFICLDASNGEEKWTTKPFGKYWSMVANGDHILALDQRGELLLIQANPAEFQLIDRRQVADDSWSHVAVCGDEVFVRALDSILAFQWR